jgi:hemerythrin
MGDANTGSRAHEVRVTLDWDDGMSVGVDAIDALHRQVWRRIRHLANAVSDGHADEVRSALHLLQGYLEERVPEEERWMEDAGYPGAREHIRGHAEILARIAAARESEHPELAKPLFETADWVARALEAHMRTEDLKLGRFWTARENLRRLAEAGPGVGAALTPLPGSLEPIAIAPARREAVAHAAPTDLARESDRRH